MVTVDFSQKLVRQLELYLWQANQFNLPATGYDLLLLLPISPESWSDKRTLLLSAPTLFRQSRWDTTHAILTALRAGLDAEEYLSIYNVDIIEPDSYAVQQVRHYLKYQADGEISAPITLIGGTTNQLITAIKSTVLDKLALHRQYQVTTLTASFTGELVRISAIKEGANSKVNACLQFKTSDGQIDCLYSDLDKLDFSVS